MAEQTPRRMRPKRDNRPGATLIEMLVIFALIGLTILGAKVFHGLIGTRWAYVLGGVVGFLVIPGVVALCALFDCLARSGIPNFPRCRSGRCRGGRDYELERFGEELDWVCKCGDRYQRCGRRFMRVNDKGEAVRYIIWRPFRGWFPDEEKP